MAEPNLIVAIYLRGERLQPDHISAALNLQPSRSQRTGGLAFHSKKVIAKVGLWAIIAQTNSLIISDHIDELLTKIGNPTVSLDVLEGVQEAYLDVFVPTDESPDGRKTIELIISSKHLRELARLGLSIHFNVM